MLYHVSMPSVHVLQGPSRAATEKERGEEEISKPKSSESEASGDGLGRVGCVTR